MKKLIVLLLLLSSCSWLSKPIDVPKLPLNLQEPAPLDLEDMEFYVVTTENQEHQFIAVKKAKGGEALFCLSDTGYHNLADNMQKIQNYIIIERNLIQSYKNYYESKKD